MNQSTSKNTDKHTNQCKQCSYEEYEKSRKTPQGVTCSMYGDQRKSSRIRNMEYPNYTLDELREWVFSQEQWDELYNNWLQCGCDKYMKPSCDRLDDYKGYSFDNIRLVTWKENNEKHYSDEKNGNNTKRMSSVVQYDLKGNFIKEYYSQAQAERETGIPQGNICKVCIQDRLSAGGFIWKYKK